jgi:hypothetical protein
MSKKIAFYRYIRDFVDADYLKNLSPEDRAWYEQFQREYYGVESKKFGDKAILNREQYLEAQKQNFRASNDLMTYKFRSHAPLETLEETPEFERGVELLQEGNEKKLGGRPKKPRAPRPKKILFKKD